MTSEIAHTKAFNAVTSPQPSDTDVPQESINSSDDELEWPDAFSSILGEDSSILQNLPSTICTTSACIITPEGRSKALPLCLPLQPGEFVDLAEAEGRRRGQELLAMLEDHGGMVVDLSAAEGRGRGQELLAMLGEHGGKVDDHWHSKQFPVDTCPASHANRETTNNLNDRCSSELWHVSNLSALNCCSSVFDSMVAEPFSEVMGSEGCARTKDFLCATVQSALGDWYSDMHQNSDGGFLIKLSMPMRWSCDSALDDVDSAKAQVLDLSLACLDECLWHVFQLQGALSLQRSTERPQLIVTFAPKGHSKDDMCWHFLQNEHCPKRNCRWIHKKPSTFVIDVELEQHR